MIQEEQTNLQLFHSVTTCHLGDVGGIIRQAPLPTVLDETLLHQHIIIDKALSGKGLGHCFDMLL